MDGRSGDSSQCKSLANRYKGWSCPCESVRLPSTGVETANRRQQVDARVPGQGRRSYSAAPLAGTAAGTGQPACAGEKPKGCPKVYVALVARLRLFDTHFKLGPPGA